MDITKNKLQPAKKPRIFEITILNVLFCMLVIFIHVSSRTVFDLGKNSWQYIILMIPWRLSGFVVQGFIFLSGLKLFLTKPNGVAYGKFCLNRLIYIVLPYTAWVFIYYLHFYLNNYFPFEPAAFFKYVLIGDLSGHFYFVIIIIQFYLLAPFWYKLIKKADSTVLVALSLMLTIILNYNLPDIIRLFKPSYNFQYTDRVFTSYLVYWIAGCYAGLNYEKFKTVMNKNRLGLSIIFLIVTIANLRLSYLNFSGRQYIHWLDNVHMLYCICAVLFCYSASLLFVPQNNQIKKTPRKFKRALVGLINGIDKISYEIYLAHCLILFKTNDFLARFPNASLSAAFFTRVGSVYIITISGLLLFNFVRSRLFNLMKGRKKCL